MNNKNPFNQNTLSYIDWQTMSDLQWHCSKCELKSAQAKTWQIWRQKGINLDWIISKNNNKQYYCQKYCLSCKKNTYHRKLKSLEITNDTTTRTSIPASLAKRIKALYKNEEAIFLRILEPNELEIDHKFPQIRWNKNESTNKELSDQEIKNKFMLLSRRDNLLKSRQCEKCKKTNIRPSFPGIEFFYKGNKNFIHNINNPESGCIGCFWYDPYEWRKHLQEILNAEEVNKKC